MLDKSMALKKSYDTNVCRLPMSTSVKPVETSMASGTIVKKNTPLQISCSAEGYYPPDSMSLKKDGSDFQYWTNDSSSTVCSYNTHFYRVDCSFIITDAAGYLSRIILLYYIFICK